MLTSSNTVYNALLFASAIIRASASIDCSVLETLTFRQHEAPVDISSVVSTITTLMDKQLEGVEDMTITWEGDFVYHAIGSYSITANVKIGGETARRCYTTLIRVTDTNECDKRVPSKWQHACDESSVCVNENGSYACACVDGSFVPLGVMECSLKDHSFTASCLGANESSIWLRWTCKYIYVLQWSCQCYEAERMRRSL